MPTTLAFRTPVGGVSIQTTSANGDTIWAFAGVANQIECYASGYQL